MMVIVMMIMEELMMTSTITISRWDHNRYPFGKKKPWDDGDLARHPGPTDGRPDGRTDKAAYRDAKTHLKTLCHAPQLVKHQVITVIAIAIAIIIG